MNGSYLITLIGGLIISAFIGRYIAKEKGRDTSEGFLFGLLGGVIGLVIVAVLPNKSKIIKPKVNNEPPSERDIQKAKDNDFFSRIIGIIFAIFFIGLIYWALTND